MNIFIIFLLSAVITMPLLSNTAIISEKLDLNIAVSNARNCSYITLSESDITMKSQTMYNITATASNVQCYNSVLKFFNQHPSVVEVYPKYLIVDRNAAYNVRLKAIAAGKSEIRASYYCLEKFSDSYIKVSVFHSNVIEVISYITGWSYLITWSFANCPQIWSNYKRKSIAGLSMDYVILHSLGHTYYTIFNVALLYVPVVKKEYALRFPKSAKPVVFSDVIYSIIVTIMAYTILIQAFIYGMGEQRSSKFLKTFLLFCGCVKAVTIILISKDALQWLDFVYVCSYLKLAISIKYVPQVVAICRQKSTEGFSMMQVFLDLSGGFLSIAHMVFIAYNYNDWPLFFENCTKFGLGLLSICFDCIFIVQHYVIFANTKHQGRKGNIPAAVSSTAL